MRWSPISFSRTARSVCLELLSKKVVIQASTGSLPYQKFTDYEQKKNSRENPPFYSELFHKGQWSLLKKQEKYLSTYDLKDKLNLSSTHIYKAVENFSKNHHFLSDFIFKEIKSIIYHKNILSNERTWYKSTYTLNIQWDFFPLLSSIITLEYLINTHDGGVAPWCIGNTRELSSDRSRFESRSPHCLLFPNAKNKHNKRNTSGPQNHI